ncbi:MAG TPA: MogA/MoaB family molybdenum cofactor biosynthesis protein [Solirubrobacterales bacterium]
MKAAAITVSSSRSEGDGGPDESGPRLAALIERLGGELAGTDVIADDREAIAARLRHWVDQAGCDLVLTSGGTGLAPSDVTPEATRDVIDREAPGIAEALRAASRPHTDHWMLSRGIAGTRGRALIVNFPGSPRSIEETAPALEPALSHALRLLSDAYQSHPPA